MEYAEPISDGGHLLPSVHGKFCAATSLCSIPLSSPLLNGTRLLYNNLAANATVGDFALSEIPAPNHLQWHHLIVDHTKLVPGRNLLAVEVHQASANGSDLSFDLQLTGELKSGPPVLHLTRAGSDEELAWPAAFDDWNLRASTDLQTWTPMPEPLLRDGAWLYLQTPHLAPRRFFRLQKP